MCSAVLCHLLASFISYHHTGSPERMTLALASIWLIGGLVVALIATLVHNAIICRLALEKTKKKFPRIPVMRESSWLGNHLSSLAMDQNCQRICREHADLGDIMLGLMNTRLLVSIVDLDLLKQIVLDQASVNINRVELPMPMSEYDCDNLMTCEDEQWKCIRKVFAPALK